MEVSEASKGGVMQVKGSLKIGVKSERSQAHPPPRLDIILHGGLASILYTSCPVNIRSAFEVN